MNKKIDTSEQFLEFFIKKAANLAEIAENHYKNREYKKCLELLNQAYSFYVKGNAKDLAGKIKERFNEIKETHFKKKD